MKRDYLAVAVLAVTVLVGCTTTRVDPEPRSYVIPAKWAEEAEGGETSLGVKAGWVHRLGDKELPALVSEAVSNNLDLEAAAARVSAALERAKIAGAPLYPGLDFSADGSKSQSLTRAAGGADDFDGFVRNRTTSLGIGLNLSWELDLWGRIRKGQRAERQVYLSVVEDWQAARLSLAGQVAKAWFGAVEAKLQKELSTEILESHTMTVKLVKSRFEKGLASAFEVHLSESDKASAEGELKLRENQYETSVRSLEVLLGRYPSTELEVKRDFGGVEHDVPAGIPSELLGRRPDIRSRWARVASFAEKKDQARSARLPRLSLTAGAGTTSDALRDLVDPKHDVWNFAVNLAQPIFDAGRLAAEERRADAELRESVAEYGRTALGAFLQVEEALGSESFLRERESFLRSAAGQAKLAFE